MPFLDGSYYYWQVKITDLLVQGDSVFSDTYKIAILDSGTSLTVVPLKEMTKIANLMTTKFKD